MNDQQPPQLLTGLAVTIVGALVLTAFASVAPAGIRKLILFAMTFGIGVGGIAAIAAARYSIPRRVMLLLTPLLVINGLTFAAWRTHRELVVAQRVENLQEANSVPQMPVLESIAEQDPETAAMLDRERQQREPDFLQFLAVRTRQLGEWDHPWPLVLWLSELALGALASVLVLRHWSPFTKSAALSDSANEEELGTP